MNAAYEIEIAKSKAAESDCRKARKVGRLLIGQTTKGLVELSYDRATRSYAIVSQDGGSYRVGRLALSGAVTRLSALYVVEVQ